MSYVYALILFAFAVLAFFYASRVFYNKNYRKKTFLQFSLTALASGAWSLGYAGMLIFEDEAKYMFMRGLGIIGLFAFLILAQVLVGTIAEYSKKIFVVIGIETVVGSVVCYLSVRPGSVKLINTPKGIVTEFVNPTLSLVYTIFTLVVAFIFIAASVNMLRPKYRLNVRVFGRNTLIVEGLILLGMVVDTVLPALGTNLNIPASTMMQFVGLDIVYHAVHKVDRNVVSLQNLAGYAYKSLKSPIIVFDMFNRMTIINQEARRVLGLTDKDINRDDFLQEAYGLENPFDNVSEYKTKEFDGKYLKGDMYSHMYADPILNEFGDYIGYILMISDVTSNYLYTQELESAKEEAMRANRAKSLFLANMSHEIRTPMNSILGFSELCLKEELPEVPKGYVSDIYDSAKILLTIINDILDISKIESGKMELVECDYSPRDVFTNLSKVISLLASKKNLDYHFEMVDDFPHRLNGDKTKIRAILINLLNNGIKYTDKGSVSLHISFEKLDDDNCRVKFVIKDTGIGIKKEDINSIFDVFQRVDLSTNSTTEGTGLGLSITKGFVNLMHGSIEVDSEYGEGTSFTIFIDQKIVEMEEPQRFEKGTPVEAGKQLRLRNVSVLVVDDTAINLKLISVIMERYGANVTVAQSGQESIELCRNNLYDIVLMDQMMPVMDGVTAMREIRKLGNGYETGGSRKIVTLTANVVDGARNERISEGFDDFLGKPINVRRLESVLMTYLGEDRYYFVDGH